MKYVISESRLNYAIYDYIEKTFSQYNICDEHPIEYERAVNHPTISAHENIDTSRITFYDCDTEEPLMRYYTADYFSTELPKKNCPFVTLESELEIKFNRIFSELWVEPFKEWFTLTFELPLKNVKRNR